MRLEGISLQGGAEQQARLSKLLRDLPHETINGCSSYDSTSVFFDGCKVVIRAPSQGDVLTVNFPKGSTRNIASREQASFDYRGTKYEIHY